MLIDPELARRFTGQSEVRDLGWAKNELERARRELACLKGRIRFQRLLWLDRAIYFRLGRFGPPWAVALAISSVLTLVLSMVSFGMFGSISVTVAMLALGYILSGGGLLVYLWDRYGESDVNRSEIRKRKIDEVLETLGSLNVERMAGESRKGYWERITIGLESAVRSRILHLLNVQVDSLSGSDFERFLGNVMAEHGWEVQWIGGAGDQGVDLIAIKHGCRLAVQAKRYTDSVSNAAVQEVFLGSRIHHCDRMMVVTTGVFTKGARQAAEAAGCILVERNDLERLIRCGPQISH